jgi:hypothetical protein
MWVFMFQADSLDTDGFSENKIMRSILDAVFEKQFLKNIVNHRVSPHLPILQQQQQIPLEGFPLVVAALEGTKLFALYMQIL